ncbi:MAG: glycosyltransferase family 2 protein [Candidatus Aureabacteria bacterium]|nr:glycosyltransferase family 2 protein [Candidatus Auribacterota bacterium]
MKTVSVIIPAYNEEAGIGRVVDQVLSILKGTGWKHEVIVVNDGSTDRTGAVLKTQPVEIIEHDVNRGYGASLKNGISRAAFDYILIMDADGTYPEGAIPALLQEAEKYDMVVGARTGTTVAIPPHRRFPKWCLKKLADYLTGMKIPDLNSGLRVFTKASALKFLNLLPSGFSFTTTITVALLSNNYRVHYVPIDYHKRKGKSKFRPFQDTFNLFGLIVRTSLYFNPLKIFLPLSACLFLLAVLILFYSKFFTPKVMDITVIVVLMASLQILALGLIADLVDKRSQR